MKIFWIVAALIIGALASQLLDHQPTQSLAFPVAAVTQQEGIIGKATLSLVPGEGRVLLDSLPITDVDLQRSIVIALAYAKYYTGKTLGGNDLVIDFDMPLEVIGGVSSGAALTVGTIALLEGKAVDKSVVLTGMVNPDGSIGRVGEIREKALAAQGAGYRMLLVPQGQSRIRYRQLAGFEGQNQSISLKEFLNLTIEIREVATIEEAAELMIK